MMTFFDLDLVATLLAAAEIKMTVQREGKLIICHDTDIPTVTVAIPHLYSPFVGERVVFGKPQIIVNLGLKSLWRWIPDTLTLSVGSLFDVNALASKYAELYGFGWKPNVMAGKTITLYGPKMESLRVAYAIKETINQPDIIKIDDHPVMKGMVRMYFAIDTAEVASRDKWMKEKAG